MDRLQTTEALRDILQDLQSENASLRLQAYQAKLLFTALQSLLSLDTGNDPFAIAFSSLHAVFEFHAAAVLEEEGETLECIAATEPVLVGTHWEKTRLMCKVMGGRAVARIEGGGRSPTPSCPTRVSSDQPAMFLPIRLEAKRGAIVLLRKVGQDEFTRDDATLGERFSLLVSQALAIRRRHLSETENQRLQEITRKLEHRAQHDDLTGIGNRAMLEKHGTEALAARREDEMIALVFIDVDRFKRINDYFGHETGDALLKEIAERLSVEARPADCVVRMSGDEFVMLISELPDMEAARARVERVRRTLCSAYEVEGNRIDVTSSIGISVCPEHGTDFQELRRNADFAMYRSKAERHGAAVFFSTEMGRDLYSSMQLERLLREAVADKAFEAALQPKVRIADRKVVGFEALARWREADGTIRSPAEFIRAATELGILNAVTFAVTDDALTAFDTLDARFGDETSISLNIAGVQANDPAFMSELVARIAASGRANRMILELTEDAMVQAPQFRALVQPMLGAAGIRVAIDDFGTGYSSLSVLAELDANELKIDRSFVTRIQHNPVNQRILRAIEKLAHAIGLQTVAEGVETQEELAYLQAESSVDIVQGYYFSPPMMVEDLMIWTRPDTSRRIYRIG
ncbi:diguanylate cyclase/phosphodiesterase [Breoghania corrubedonensis]|uniref:Diguanylate cyclase/phosphodiesterase n=1 Tax=Breoghania corrubedonensis TaxID=665038 RepID=A0A2T5VGZ4_9HYPH|nr:EAL domain-containing protein [Breoghania corrubedonensis]PTW63014.1 diguanylate cyclase/phosphodiesterase [Breoghania corrubedonensis]